MQGPTDVIGLIGDLFTWVGFGGAALAGAAALILVIADGTWLPARGVVEHVDGGHVVRWFDADGGVNEAPLSEADHEKLGGRDMADIYYRRGWQHRMRITSRSPGVRATLIVAGILAAVGVIAVVVSWVLLAVQG